MKGIEIELLNGSTLVAKTVKSVIDSDEVTRQMRELSLVVKGKSTPEKPKSISVQQITL